jgi:large subunit ribosomal protein L29
VDIKELRDCTDERLADLEKTLRRQIFDARIKNYTNQLDDTASIRVTRRDLARVKTIMNERGPGVSASGSAASGGAAASDAPAISDAAPASDAAADDVDEETE